MTASARITQADMDRAAKMVRNVGFEHARIVLDLANARIEVIIGEGLAESQTSSEQWDDDDV